MKKINKSFLLIGLVLLNGCQQNEEFKELKIEGDKYYSNSGFVFNKIDDDNLVLIDYIGEYSNIFVNEKYDGYSVSEISYEAFKKNEVIKNVTLPSTITTIGDSAFLCCSNLSTIFIPRSVTYIGKDAFYNCYNLTIYCESTEKSSNWSYWWNVDNCPTYFYSEEIPNNENGNYWHYNEKNEITKW